jgi:putative ABC transport system permease protein
MFKNYIKIAWRNIVKHKGYSLINTLGLTVGIAVCLLILLYVRSELSFDGYHTDKDNIYRIQKGYMAGDGSLQGMFCTLAPSYVPLLENDFPEIEHAVRMYGSGNHVVSIGDRNFKEPRLYFAEADIFEVFSIPLLEGNPETALQDPGAIVLSESSARKLFGTTDVMGKTLKLDDRLDCSVAGLMADPPFNTHLHMDILASYQALKGVSGRGETDYFHGTRNFSDNVTLTYVRFAEGTDIDALKDELKPFLDRHIPSREDEEGNVIKASERNLLFLQKMKDIHLHSNTRNEMEPNSDIKYVFLFTLIAVFILAIACINFMNLSTARSAQRAKEVGLRKVVGADRRGLMLQFIGESLLFSLLSLTMALILVLLLLPWFSGFSGHNLAFGSLFNLTGILLLAGVFLVAGIVSGLYPSLYISAYRPAAILKGMATRGRAAAVLRKALVVFQFAISIVLIFSVTVVAKQMRYIQNADLGYDRDNIVTLNADRLIITRWNDIKPALLQNPLIESACISKRAPTGRLLDSPGFQTEVYGEVIRSRIQMPHNRVSFDFIKTFGMEIVAGRDFSRDIPTDATQAFILNETAVKALGWKTPEEALDSPMAGNGRRGRVIGVVRDFNYESLHSEIPPILTYVLPQQANTISVRLSGGSLRDGVNAVRDILTRFRPGMDLDYQFLTDRITALYLNEERMMEMFGYFSGLAVLIGCLGLFGLASYSAVQRTKEIGIRKVLGASASGIALLLARDLTKWVILANLIAWPAAFWFMKGWLKNFAYRTSIGWEPFLLSAVLAAAVALITVSFQSAKAAISDPVKSLRYE